jgi:phosphoribosyl-ATP pyrophosphohydrolase/phosphoribosyl-AMP cyclohydrolase
MTQPTLDLEALNFAKGGGVVTVVTQDAATDAVLMVAFADREALEHTLASGEMHYRSRSRGLWHKGATSGHIQKVVSLAADCDGDAVLARVRQTGAACHTGQPTCFGDAPSNAGAGALSALDDVIERRASSPDTDASYTQRLLGNRNLRLKKLGEESVELAVALADRDRSRAVEEAADVIYHLLVALRAEGVGLREIGEELERRAR